MSLGLRNRQITAKVVEAQRDLISTNIGSYSFYFSFSREPIEIERLSQPSYLEFHAQHERMGRFSQFISYYKEKPQGDRSVIYDVGITISPNQALKLLSTRTVKLQWGVRDDWPKRSEDDKTPSIGIGFYFRFRGPDIGVQTDCLEYLSLDKQHSIRGKLMDRHLKSADIWVSSEYRVYDRYEEGEWAEKRDFRFLRFGLWHEIMEIVIIFITTEAFCFPYDMYKNLLSTEERGEGPENFAHKAVMKVQARIQNDQNLWLYWDDDPPFDSFEVTGYARETEAERLEGNAVSLERQGNWAAAREKWIKAGYLLHRGGWGGSRCQEDSYPLRTHPGHTLDSPPPISTIVYKDV